MFHDNVLKFKFCDICAGICEVGNEKEKIAWKDFMKQCPHYWLNRVDWLQGDERFWNRRSSTDISHVLIKFELEKIILDFLGICEFSYEEAKIAVVHNLKGLIDGLTFHWVAGIRPCRKRIFR